VNTAEDHWTLVCGEVLFPNLVLSVFSLDGKEVWSDAWTRNRSFTIPFPESMGLYVLSFRSLDGHEGAIRILRP